MAQIKLNSEHVEQIKWLCNNTCMIDRQIGEIFGVTRKHIWAIRNKKRWNYDHRQDTDRNVEQELIRRTCIHG